MKIEVLAPSAPGLAPMAVIDGVTVRRFRYAPRSHETLAYAGTMAEQVCDSVGGKLALGLLVRGTTAVRSAVRRMNSDVVHAHWWFPSGLLVTARAPQRPLVTTLHGSDVRLARTTSWAPALFRRVANRSARVTAVSSWLATEARAMAPRVAVAVEPMPVDIELFTPGGPREPLRFLFVGRLNAQKGVAILLDALAATHSAASLDIVGNGPDRTALEARVVALGLGGRVTFHGALAQGELVPLYRAATAVVVPSANEGLGLVAVEAQLCEAPVIAFRSGGLVDTITDGQTGLLVPPGDVRALSSAMDSLTQGEKQTGWRCGARPGRARSRPRALCARGGRGTLSADL